MKRDRQEINERPVTRGESAEHRALVRAIEKAHSDREAALRAVCRLYGVKSADALPPGVLAAAVALITGS
jgi:hypothetical protein